MLCDEIFRYYFKTGNLSREDLIELCKIADVNEKDSNGCTPLHAAARFSDMELAEIILAGGADPNAADNYGDTPLDILGKSDRVSQRAPPGNMYRLTVLLMEAKANPHKKDESGKTCYLYAARDGNWELVQALRDKGTRLKGIADGGENGLHIAAYNARRAVDRVRAEQKYADEKRSEEPGSKRANPRSLEELERESAKAKEFLEDYFKTVKAFLDGGVDPDDINDNGQKPLEIAKSSGAKKIAALLDGSYAEGGKDAESAAKAGGMSLHEAVIRRDAEAVRARLGLGADVNEISDEERFKGMTPLAAAARAVNTECMEILLAAGADPNFKDGNEMTAAAYMFSYMTALNVTPDVFTENKAQKAMKMLIEAGLDRNGAVDGSSNTLLTCACLSPNRSPGYNHLILRNILIDEMIRCGIDVNAANKNGQTALMGACLLEFKENESVILALLENGARTDVSDSAGNTPLIYAAQNPSKLDAKQITDLLFDFGDTLPDAVNNAGKSALDYATLKDNEMLVKLLLSKM
ncbi:MAG: ankyrin repeat domain-containing protein [Methanosarcinales archaeon]|jgi:ankyrin repeat protein|nr:ankyrin repeat domain-containing protein [Methanosarcinales archaeon]